MNIKHFKNNLLAIFFIIIRYLTYTIPKYIKFLADIQIQVLTRANHPIFQYAGKNRLIILPVHFSMSGCRKLDKVS
jgi:hypothetical protein